MSGKSGTKLDEVFKRLKHNPALFRTKEKLYGFGANVWTNLDLIRHRFDKLSTFLNAFGNVADPFKRNQHSFDKVCQTDVGQKLKRFTGSSVDSAIGWAALFQRSSDIMGTMFVILKQLRRAVVSTKKHSSTRSAREKKQLSVGI